MTVEQGFRLVVSIEARPADRSAKVSSHRLAVRSRVGRFRTVLGKKTQAAQFIHETESARAALPFRAMTMNRIPKIRRYTPATEQVWPPDAEGPQSAQNSQLARRLAQRFYGISLGLALPLAVFTSNGLLGLLVHAIALSGAASLLEQSARKYARSCPASAEETPR
jgi:hypothetical protein